MERRRFDHKAEFKKFHVTVSDLKRPDRIVKYKIDGVIYTFGVVDPYEETMDGYCFERKKWAWLYPNCVWFKDEFAREAEKIS